MGTPARRRTPAGRRRRRPELAAAAHAPAGSCRLASTLAAVRAVLPTWYPQPWPASLSSLQAASRTVLRATE